VNLAQFDRVVALDTEFVPAVGGHLRPVCLVAHELKSGKRIRLWHDELGAEPPFPADDRTLYVAYMAAAEIGFFLACGWPAPARVLDLFVEFRNLTDLALPKNLGVNLLACWMRCSTLTFMGYQSARRRTCTI
jgi:DNA polymerase I